MRKAARSTNTAFKATIAVLMVFFYAISGNAESSEITDEKLMYCVTISVYGLQQPRYGYDSEKIPRSRQTERYKGLQIIDQLSKNDDHRSKFCLGQEYEIGRYIPRSYPKAAEQYRLAISKGSIRAKYNLGVMHFLGRGMPENKTEAHRLFEEAAYLGHPGSQREVGLRVYYEGNHPESYAWYILSSVEGLFYEDYYWSENSREQVRLLPYQMKPEHVQQAKELADELFLEILKNLENR